MKTAPQQKLRFWQLLFLLTALVMILNVVVVIYSLSRLSNTYDAVERTMQMMMSIRATYSAIQDIEISERDYLLWGNEDSLQIYRDSVSEAVVGMRRIDAIEYNTQAFAMLVNFESLLSRRLRVNSLEQLIFPYAGTPTPAESWSVPESASLLQELRSTIMEIESSHAKLLSSRRAELQTGERSISLAVAFVTGFGVLSIALMYRALKRSLAQQEHWETQLLQQKARLEELVTARTAALQLSNRELERSNRELEDFAFIASHDLQEPLRKILAFGDRLKERCGDELGKHVDYLTRMQSAATRMSMLIQDLLEFSRVTSKPKEFELVSLNAILADVLEDLEEAISESGAIIESDLLPDIWADSTQMHQLLQNLIGNAVKFMRPQTPPRVRLTAKIIQQPPTGIQDEREVLEIHVIDNGIGFDSEYTERIFKPFQRLHSRTDYSGTGIGLALCRRIIERHNGDLIASSKIGQGSDFMIVLPIEHQLLDSALTSESLLPDQSLHELNKDAS